MKTVGAALTACGKKIMRLDEFTEREREQRGHGEDLQDTHTQGACVHVCVRVGVGQAAETEEDHCFHCHLMPTFLHNEVKTTEQARGVGMESAS